MFLTKVVEKIKAHIFYSLTFFENCAIYEIMWKNTMEPGKPHENKAHVQCMLDT
jgi:hypothetical protein